MEMGTDKCGGLNISISIDEIKVTLYDEERHGPILLQFGSELEFVMFVRLFLHNAPDGVIKLERFGCDE